MTILNAFFFGILLALAAAQSLLLPVSNCLGNCLGCLPQSPNVCLNEVKDNTGQQIRCVPYYQGADCSIGGSYYNLYTENGVLNNFANWSLSSQPQSQKCDSLNGGSSFSAIGPFNTTLNATKSLQFSAAQNVRRLLIKIVVGVSDSRLTQQKSNTSQTVEFVEINGTLFMVTNTTTQNQTTQTIPFLSMQLIDTLNSNSVVKTSSTAFQSPSSTQTKCGFVFQYQFQVEAASATPFQQLLLNLFLPVGSPTLWWLFDFRVQGGCSGFSVGSTCSNCLTGFYPASTASGYASGCKHCDLACSTCGSGGICLSCQVFATYNAGSRSCSIPSSYTIYNNTQSYKVIAGSKINVTSQFFSQIYGSSNKQLTLGFNLKNNQSYMVKMNILYPKSYVDSGSFFTISIDGKEWNTSNVNANRGTLSNINNGAFQLFTLPFSIDRMGEAVLSSSQIQFKVSGVALVEQFYVADLSIIQYQCTSNCLQCSFSLTQVTTCSKCLPFYRKDNNCLTCANGFFQILSFPQNRCVKCFSNCMQCTGPSRYDCTECYEGFELSNLVYDMKCITKISNQFKNLASPFECPSAPTNESVVAQPDCLACLSQTTFNYADKNCVTCWLIYDYVWGRCKPISSSGLTFFVSQADKGETVTGWKGNGLSPYNCTADYIGLTGVPNVANNLNSTVSPTSISTTFSGLPSHFGLRFYINLFKIDYWPVDANAANKVNPLSLTVVLGSPDSPDSLFTVALSNNVGANICGQSSNEMIWALNAQVGDHSSSTVTVTIQAPDRGIFVRDLQIYLGNCPDCSKVGLSYFLFLLPVYADNNTQTGIDAFVTFNNPLQFQSGGQSQFQVESFASSFNFQINGSFAYYSIKQSYLDDKQLRYAKYFLPSGQSYVNTTVVATTNQPDIVYTETDGIKRQLVSSSEAIQLERYVDATEDTRKSMSQLSDFFKFFTWFALITMIVAVGLGVGVVFQEFSQVMQIIYYHIYITSWLLPPTLKVPLSHASRMEHLNYFGNIQTIQNNLFGLDPLIPSNYIFMQYNIDVYFLRSLYPILIINAIFIGWFIIFKLLEIGVASFRNSPNKLVRFLRSIPSRPLAYFDQIWRYQFLAVMWACMLQFTSFQGDGSKKVNLAICVLAFIISILWPVVVLIYTYRRHFTTNAKHFLYLYHDLYYLKTSSLCDQPKSYIYSGIRAIRLLAYAVFIALFVNQSIIGPVLLIAFNLADVINAYFLDIFRTGAYLFTRIIENILLIVSAILCMVIYGFADKDSLSQSAYENLGYAVATIFVLLIINGIVRTFYLIYKKIKEWSVGTYDVGERGELQNFDDRSPVKIPQSQRLQSD